MSRAVTAVLLAVGLAACSSNPPQRLPLPARPEVPKIESGELECVSDETYSEIVTRDRRLREYAEQLRAVIRSTHPEGQQ